VGKRRKKTRNKKQKHVFSVHLSYLDYALLDFVIEKVGPSEINTSALIRRAVEDYIVRQDIWDQAEFSRFAQRYGETQITSKRDRDKFFADVERLLHAKPIRVDSTETFSDLQDLNIATSHAIFER
jgi:hypothetical protein